MALTSFQRKTLRQHAQNQRDDLHLGKAGMTEGFKIQMQDLFRRKELIKVRLAMQIEGQARLNLAQELAAASQAEPVAVLGKTVLLYKANLELDTPKRLLVE